MSAKVSVIVPVYNAKDTLKRCLESIINQTYSNLEIILVDDGSSDGSGKLCDEYANKDNRIVVKHTKNCGVSAARNTGFNLSTGEFICFVDSDDYLQIGLISIAISHIYDDDTDVVAFGYNNIIGDKVSEVSAQKYVGKATPELFDYCISNGYSVYIWNKLYKRQVVIKYFNEHFKNCEDFLFNSQFFSGYIKISIIGNCLYNFCHKSKRLGKIYSEDYLQRLNLISQKICLNLNVSLIDLPNFCGFLLIKTLDCISQKKDKNIILKNSKNFIKVLTKYAKVSGLKNKVCLLLCKMGLIKISLKLV